MTWLRIYLACRVMLLSFKLVIIGCRFLFPINKYIYTFPSLLYIINVYFKIGVTITSFSEKKK